MVASQTEAWTSRDDPAVGGVTDHHTRYPAGIRSTGAVLAGLAAGVLIINSMQVGAKFALERSSPMGWGTLMWGNHWAWRGAASLVATAAASFVAGMIARRHGAIVAVCAALPSAAIWALVAYAGWRGHAPFLSAHIAIPLGYQIVASLLVFATLPVAAAAGSAGAPFGAVNGRHFDLRRAALLGIKWYHFLWIPFLLHAMVLEASFGAVYGFNWLLVAWRSAMSLLVVVPAVFLIAIATALECLGKGAFATYEALAGFDDPMDRPVWVRVLRFGLGSAVLTALVEAATVLVQSAVTAFLS